MTSQCETHPERAAVYECDGCRKLLCEECIEEGHRLLFCGHCGEMAIPLAGAPATTVELAKERKITADYSLGEALAYPFRGLGLYLFVGYVLLVILLDLASAVPGLGCATFVFQALILLILPGFLFAIVRTSAEGETELPDWPDWSDFGERFGEWIAFLLVMVMAALPTWLLLWLGGCGLGELFYGGWGLGCWALLAAGMVAGVVLWVPGVGAVGTYGSGWLGWRADLHIRALINVFDDAVVTLVLLAVLWMVSLFLRVFLIILPVMGTISSVAVGVYTLFVGAHLIGLLFRRNTKTLESIYLG
ncbi:MAG: B-box zinc finger protein [Thermoanaerobaculia bacterium]